MPARNIFFIGPRVSDYQSVIDGLSETAKVFVLKSIRPINHRVDGALLGNNIAATNTIAEGSGLTHNTNVCALGVAIAPADNAAASEFVVVSTADFYI